MKRKFRKDIFILALLTIILICCQNVQCNASINKNVKKMHSNENVIQYGNYVSDTNIEPVWRLTDKLITSGVYTYRIIDVNSKNIELRGINSQETKIIIPHTIDGYNVKYIGYSESVSNVNLYSAHDLFKNEDFDALKLKGCEDTLTELVIPDCVKSIGACAFKNFKHLTKVVLNNDLAELYGRAFEGCALLSDINIPTETSLGDEVFYGCESLKSITLSCTNKININCLFDCSNFDEIHLTNSDIEDSEKCFDITMELFGANTNINRVIVDSEIKKVELDRNINEVIINGKNTKLSSNRASDCINKTAIKTVQGAKAISFAKKNKLNYEVKYVTKVKNLKNKRIKSKLVFNWNKCKTQIVSNKYNVSLNKWKSVVKKVKTQYDLYGKMKKNDEYNLFDTISKTKLKTSYKFIKVQPVTNY